LVEALLSGLADDLSAAFAHLAALVVVGQSLSLAVQGFEFSVTLKYSSATVLSAIRA